MDAIRTATRALLAFVVMTSLPCVAAMKDIRTEKLPQNPSVQQAYDDVAKIEPYVKDWNADWRFSVSKADVVKSIESSLAALQDASRASPDNSELQLLTGWIAHYAYNVDVENSYRLAEKSFERAHELAQSDIRPEWFRGIHHCQSSRVEEGMRELLAVEQNHSTSELPVTFWDDYITCASIALMPAHVLRAATYTRSAESSQYRDFLIDVARKRFTPGAPKRTYAAKEVWASKQTDVGPKFAADLCGVEFWSKSDWQLDVFDVKNGECVAQIETGPYRYKEENVYPNIVLLVKQAKPGESLADFLRSFEKSGVDALDAPACPVERCVSHHAVAHDMYKKAGDGHAIWTAFEREAPQFPGLLFEEPAGPPTSGSKSDKPTYYRARERFRRLDGKLYYLVMLDTASSVIDQAKNDYVNFIKAMRVE